MSYVFLSMLLVLVMTWAGSMIGGAVRERRDR
jgi:hypothetical protein